MFFYMISELFWQCGIFLNVFLHDFGIVLTVWYFFTWFRNYFDSVVFFDIISELFWQCGIFLPLSEQFRNDVEKYHTFRTVPKWCRKIPHYQNSSEIMSKNITLSEHFRNHVEKYQTVRKIPKSCSKILELIQTPILLTHKYMTVHFPALVQIHEETYNTVRAIQKVCRKIPHCQCSSEIM
jgi:hypothetical protein